MLAKDRDERYGGAEELLSAIRRVRVALGSWKRGAGTGRRRPISQRAFRKRNRAELVVAGVAILLLSVAAVGIWRYAAGGGGGQVKVEPRPPSRTGQPGPQVPAPRPAPAKSEVGVVVFDLENLAKDENTAWISHGVPRMLISKLTGFPGLVVYSRDRTEEALKAAGGKRAEAARALGARLMVSGSFVSAGGDLQIDLHVEDVTTGRVAKAITVRGKASDPVRLVNELGRELRGRFDRLIAKVLGVRNQLASRSFRSVEECLFASAPPVGSPSYGARPGEPGSGRDRGGDRDLADKKKLEKERLREREKSADAGKGPVGIREQSGKREEGNSPPAPARPKPVMTIQQRPPRPGIGVAGSSGDKPSGEKPTPPRPKHAPKTPKKPAAGDQGGALARKGPGGASYKSSGKAAPDELQSNAGSRPRWGRLADKKGSGRRMRALSRAGGKADLALALRHRFEGLELLERARTRADFERAMARFALSKSLAPHQRGIDELIKRADAGMKAAKQ
jgi:TolB-like protein